MLSTAGFITRNNEMNPESQTKKTFEAHITHQYGFYFLSTFSTLLLYMNILGMYISSLLCWLSPH